MKLEKKKEKNCQLKIDCFKFDPISNSIFNLIEIFNE